jgi:hypothetical protein
VGVLERFERRLGGLVEGAFARVFKGGVEPVELASALARECDDRTARSARRTLVPNDFVITLSDQDYQRLAPYRQALGEELATLVREHAAAQRYTFIAPVAVRLELDPLLTVGRYEIHSEVVGDAQPQPPAPPVIAGGKSRSPASRPTNPAHGGPALARLVVTVGGTAEVGTPASVGHQLEVTLHKPLTVVGRGTGADVQVADTGVSRRHGELILQPSGQHTYRDLGSTNGTKVNGSKVHEVPLVDGDRLEIGRSMLIYRNPLMGRGSPGDELPDHSREA